MTQDDDRKLTEDAQADRDQFEADHERRGCSCFISPPCGFCTHPGNPANQAEDDDAWEKPKQFDFMASVRSMCK